MIDKACFEICMTSEGPVIVDQDGKPVNKESGYLLLNMLTLRYAMKSWVYLGYSPKTELYKIGRTSTLERRAKELQIDIIHTIGFPRLSEAESSEKQLQEKFSRKCVYGEWFKLTDQDIKFIKQYGVGGQYLGFRLHPDLERWWEIFQSLPPFESR